MPIAVTGGSSRDQNHRRALQSLLSGKLPRADRDHLGLRRRLDAVLPDGRAAARRVDEPASGRAPGGMALRDWQTGWQGSLALQLHFSFEVSAACVGLVSSPPERPCENTVDRDAPLSELDSDATDFLDRPADQERCLERRRRVFLSAGSALAR